MADFIEVPSWARPPADGHPSPPRSALKPTPQLEQSALLAVSVGPTPAVVAESWTLAFREKVIPVAGVGLIGRNPGPGKGESVDHLIAVGDAERSVSKTHLAFGVGDLGFWVLDRHSTNGSAVVAVDGTVTRCEPGVRVAVASGSRIRVGDVELQVALA